MRYSIRKKIMLDCIVVVLLFTPSIVLSEPFNENNILVIKLSPLDGKAVIKNLTTKKMKVIGIGEKMGDLGKVIQILEKSIVLKPDLEKGFQEIILSIENGQQKFIKIGFKKDHDTRSVRLKTNVDTEAKQSESIEDKEKPKK